MADMALQTNAMDEGIRTVAARIDEDLTALDERVTRRRDECEKTEAALVIANGRVELLEERVRNQRSMLERFSARLDDMEGQLCHCGKGKGREALREISPVLDSPFILGSPLPEARSSNESFHSSSGFESSTNVPSSSSSTKENDLVIYDSATSRLVEIVEDPVENVDPIPVPPPVLDVEGMRRLITVRGQRAVRSAGRPKSSFHPYARCCAIGDRSSTHRAGSLCALLPPTSVGPSAEG
jgi:hypothetical protein